jgi:two-component SAPR family response regulator
MNGCELGKRIQEIDNRIKIILITAHLNQSINNPLKFPVIHKPVRLETLKNIVYDIFEDMNKAGYT